MSPQDPWPASGPDAGSTGGSPTPPPAVPADGDPATINPTAPIPPGWSTIQPPPYQPGAAGPTYPAPAGPPPSAPPGFAAPGFNAAPGYQPFPAYAPGAPSQYSGWTPPPPAPKPGVIPLRPLGVGEILDGAISYMRFNPRTVFTVSAAIAIIAALLQGLALWIVFGSLSSAAGSFSDSLANSLATDAAAADPLSSGQLAQSAAQVLISLFSIVISILATGLFTVVMAEATLGRKISVANTWARTRGRLLPLLGTTLLTSVAVALPIVSAVVVTIVLAALGGAAVAIGVALIVISIFVAIWIAIRLLLGTAICVLERVGPIRSLGRSWTLSSGKWWRLFGISLLAQIISAVVGSIVAVPFAVIGAVASVGGGDSDVTSIGFIVALTLGTLVSSLITLPFTTGVSSLLYIDTRMRREGLDIALTAAASTPTESIGGNRW